MPSLKHPILSLLLFSLSLSAVGQPYAGALETRLYGCMVAGDTNARYLQAVEHYLLANEILSDSSGVGYWAWLQRASAGHALPKGTGQVPLPQPEAYAVGVLANEPCQRLIDSVLALPHHPLPCAVAAVNTLVAAPDISPKLWGDVFSNCLNEAQLSYPLYQSFVMVGYLLMVSPGIPSGLPPKVSPEEIATLPDEVLFEVTLDGEDRLTIDDQPADSAQLYQQLWERLHQRPVPMVSIQADRATSYRAYLRILDTIDAAYAAWRNEYAYVWYGKPWAQLTPEAQRVIVEQCPKQVSIAEPTNLER